MAKSDLGEVTVLITREYGIETASITEGRRGFTAETYVVGGKDGRDYFVRIFPPMSHLAKMDSILAALEELYALGITNISLPLRTRQGQLVTHLHDNSVVLYNFIAGEPGDEVGYDYGQFVDLLARLHQATPHIKTPLPHETFQLQFANRFDQILEQAVNGTPTTPYQIELQQLLQPRREQIEHDWAELRKLALECQRTNWSPVLTHADAMAHNMITSSNGKLYLVDWDELMLSPPERDTWFQLNDDATAANFLQNYRKLFPTYKPNLLYQRFYLWRRFCEELYYFTDEILHNPSLAVQEKNLFYLPKACFEWLLPAMNRLRNNSPQRHRDLINKNLKGFTHPQWSVKS